MAIDTSVPPKSVTSLADTLFEQLAKDTHEQVVYCYDKLTGLRAIIAIHSTTLGPALGGTRIWDYVHEHDALVDALRLSKGMTYKAALANLKLGGGKAVIIGDANSIKTEALLKKYGWFINGLHGRYIAAPDVNTTMHDMEVIAEATTYVQSLPRTRGGSGDPSSFTAYGTYLGIKAAVKKHKSAFCETIEEKNKQPSTQAKG